MSCYISSNNNRFYVALESAYGSVPAITGQNRIPGVKVAGGGQPQLAEGVSLGSPEFQKK